MGNDHGHDHGHGHGAHSHHHAPGSPEDGERARIGRRAVLAGGGATAALTAFAAPALGRPLDDQVGTARTSRLQRGIWAAHADLHNHTQMSDAVGDPALAYSSLRAAGLDVAALTDHTVASIGNAPFDLCAAVPSPPYGTRNPCSSTLGMSTMDFAETGTYADAIDAPGSFTAVRGFEWSSPYLGHVNVWFTGQVTDPLATGGLTAAGLARNGISMDDLRTLLGPLLGLPGGAELIARIEASGPDGMTGLYTWLAASPEAHLAGGSDGIAGFNHPNREPETFDAFAFDARVRDRIVSMEIMNREEDYLFKNLSAGLPSPLSACLDAGWRTGLTGVTDEHGSNWGEPVGKGRTGLYLTRMSRASVKSAMLSRRMFATRERGLRLDVGANGNTRMGGTIPGRAPRVDLDIDLDWGPEHVGMPVEVQVLTSGGGAGVPDVAHVEQMGIPDPRESRPIRVRTPIDRSRTSWLVVRIADPSRPNEAPGPEGHACNNRALAYASPFWLADARPQRSSGPRRGKPAFPISLDFGLSNS